MRTVKPNRFARLLLLSLLLLTASRVSAQNTAPQSSPSPTAAESSQSTATQPQPSPSPAAKLPKVKSVIGHLELDDIV